MNLTAIIKLIETLDFKALEFSGATFHNFMEAIERAALRNILVSTNGNVSSAARFLGIARETLVMRIKRLGLEDMKQSREQEK